MYFSDYEIECFNDRKPCVGHIELNKDYTWENVVHHLLDNNCEQYVWEDSKRHNISIKNGLLEINDEIILELKDRMKNIKRLEGQIFSNKFKGKVDVHGDFMDVIYVLLQGEVYSTVQNKILKPGDWEYYPINYPHGYNHENGRISLSIAFYDNDKL